MVSRKSSLSRDEHGATLLEFALGLCLSAITYSIGSHAVGTYLRHHPVHAGAVISTSRDIAGSRDVGGPDFRFGDRPERTANAN